MSTGVTSFCPERQCLNMGIPCNDPHISFLVLFGKKEGWCSLREHFYRPSPDATPAKHVSLLSNVLQPHKTVLEKHGKPDDVIPGIKNRKDPLPSVPLSGMYNKSGGKVRLTFKLEQDQLWIGTKGNTGCVRVHGRVVTQGVWEWYWIRFGAFEQNSCFA